MIQPRTAGWLALGFSLTLGCAAQYEEPAGAQPDDEVAAEAAPAAEVPAAEPAPVSTNVERSLADLQLELANNTAQLQALGVVVPSRTSIGGDVNFGGEAGATVQERPDPGSAPATKPAAGTGGSAPQPEALPRPATPTSDDDRGTGKRKGQGRKDKPKKATDKLETDGRWTQPPPEEAKSTPLGPNEQPKLDAATRCAQVCSLSDLTCELGVQICELAQRHPDNDEYEQACVQATEDCDAAQEACDACTG